ncbi:hypothetical protein C8Q79DRAFT_576354 [Trametes meyenii]|nr:hypothetical protein C8Q79DRAFT_576354 [Trametes meyenii]
MSSPSSSGTEAVGGRDRSHCLVRRRKELRTRFRTSSFVDKDHFDCECTVFGSKPTTSRKSAASSPECSKTDTSLPMILRLAPFLSPLACHPRLHKLTGLLLRMTNLLRISCRRHKHRRARPAGFPPILCRSLLLQCYRIPMKQSRAMRCYHRCLLDTYNNYYRFVTGSPHPALPSCSKAYYRPAASLTRMLTHLLPQITLPAPYPPPPPLRPTSRLWEPSIAHTARLTPLRSRPVSTPEFSWGGIPVHLLHADDISCNAIRSQSPY